MLVDADFEALLADLTPEKAAALRAVWEKKTNPTEFESLKEALESSDWPFAVDPELIINENNEEDKIQRADDIIDIMFDNLDGKKFLDFGCGEGYTARQVAVRNAVKSVGYDITAAWDNSFQLPNLVFTTKMEDVMANGPYDLVLLYDVLDHIVNEDPVELLRRVRSLVAPGGFVYVRCHPWCSRHGTHLFRQLNKAYLHLVFTEEELAIFGLKGTPTRKIIHPLAEYDAMFLAAGFENRIRIDTLLVVPEPFFELNKKVCARIKTNWASSIDDVLRRGESFPAWQMQQQFLDYALS